MERPASEKYDLTVPPGLYHVYMFGEVDLRALTLTKADALYKRGFPYLKLKPKATQPPKVPRVKPLKKKGSSKS